MQSLLFFNKEGDNLNIKWNQTTERWEGDLIFDKNGNDTFKTIGLYTFEKIPSFEYENPDNLKLKKFQLFNEYRFNINGSPTSSMTQSVTKIESVNNDENFYSKWIYGSSFDSKYPVGSQITFNNNIYEFNDSSTTYTVIQSKQNAILILSSIDNKKFNDDYPTSGSTLSNITISGVNSIGIYNYIDSSYTSPFSDWSEPRFFEKIYDNRRFTLVNTNYNDGVYSISKSIPDKIYYKYSIGVGSFTQSGFTIGLDLLTDPPIVYKGSIQTNPIGYPNNTLKLSTSLPRVLKPGTEFKINSALVNTDFYVVDSIPNFMGISNTTYFATYSQVIYNNIIWECIDSYTWSLTSSIMPGSTYGNWTYSNYVKVTNSISNESLSDNEIKLTTNKIRLYQPYTQSDIVTLTSAADNFSNIFSYYGIDLYYDSNNLVAELKYPTKYANVSYYQGNSQVDVSIETQNRERVIEIKENLITEINKNVNKNFSYNIVFTDLDEYGLSININGQVYNQEIVWVNIGSSVDLERTIDRTIRAWLVRWYVSLVRIGIIPTLNYVGTYYSLYYNTINLKTEYPNVPLIFDVKVGTTADFYIEHSDIIFFDVSNYLLLNINGINYGQSVATHSGTYSYDIDTALSSWVSTYSDTLSDYGIFVNNTNKILSFRTKKQNLKLDYTISVGKSSLPGNDLYKIVNKKEGNFGSLMVSNEVTLPKDGTYSFESEPFATGQIISINNSVRPYNNQEYNIIYLEPTNIVLSYQGPFWGEADNICADGPFVTLAFNSGFSATGCPPAPTPPTVIPGAGEFGTEAFYDSFSLRWSSPNTYTSESFVVDNTQIVDIIYLQLTKCIYVFGSKIDVLDSYTNNVINVVNINAVDGIKVIYNFTNNYLYYLTETKVYVIDPSTILSSDTIVSTISLPNVGKDIDINISNGDVYIIYESSPTIDIWSYNNTTDTQTSTLTMSSNTYELEFNVNENDMYVTTDSSNLIRINGTSNTIYATYSFPEYLIETIFYEPQSSSMYIFGSGSSLYVLNNGTYSADTTIPTGVNNYLIYNNILDEVDISQNFGSTWSIGYKPINGTSSRFPVTLYGEMAINQFDGNLYLADKYTNQVFIVDTVNNIISHSEPISSKVTKMIYNQDRKSIYGIQNSENKIVEISVDVYAELVQTPYTYSVPDDNLYGSLSPNYTQKDDIWLKSREYIRKPRYNYNQSPQAKFIWKWETDEYPQIFLYDFSGNQLTTTGSLAYIGETPLQSINLNKTPNKDITKVLIPEYQQTVFNQLSYTLDYVDSESNISIVPEPQEVFIGFKSDNEGPVRSNLILSLREPIDFTITTTSTNMDILQFKLVIDNINGNYGIILLNNTSSTFLTVDDNGVDRGLKSGQLVKIYVRDITNSKDKYLSFNNGITFKIREVYAKYMIVDFKDQKFTNEFTKIDDYPSANKSTYLSVRFVVQDKPIGKFRVSGQTEVEDIRYKIELSNTGHNITADDVFIFKSYDINEEGIDWTFLNKKRKEMMMVRHDIFPYIGSYKSIINAINYFGYNDLHLYEYYRNIKLTLDNGTMNPDYFKLFKVEIPDIFDNTVDGWTVNDFLKHTMPNPNYEETNLFNLTYLITDKEGNNILTYSLQEVIIKLQGLKYWLQKKIIPLSHKILDITGRADFVGTNTIVHRNYDTTILNVSQEMTPIDFNLTEAYLMPVNSGSSVYTCNVDFILGSTYSNPDYFNLKVRTYKTYKEWDPFITYSNGDEISYYGKIYESVISNNKTRIPNKYDNIQNWSNTINYTIGQYTNYNNMIYQYIGTQSWFVVSGTNSIVTPLKDIINKGSLSSWVDITEWKSKSLVPVQTIKEYRTGTYSFNFTIDSNIDPFVCIEVVSDNGYGQIYSTKKNYEIRGTNDISSNTVPSDIIGPFVVINPITTTIT